MAYFTGYGHSGRGLRALKSVRNYDGASYFAGDLPSWLGSFVEIAPNRVLTVMSDHSADALEQDISESLEELTDILSKCSTSSVTVMCLSMNISTAHSLENEDRLTSPAKQIPLLLGVLLSTDEPDDPEDFGQEHWNHVRPILDRLFFAYTRLYDPKDGDFGNLQPEWIRVREVAMSAFLHYFNTGLLASVEQLIGRISIYLLPFDTEIKDLLGIGASQALEICVWIRDHLQSCADELLVAAKDEQVLRHALLDQATAERWSKEKLIEETRQSSHREKAERLFAAINALGRLNVEKLREEFPDTADQFWSQFTIARGTAPTVQYPTERSVFESKPLILLSEEEALCPNVNQLFGAFLHVAEVELLNSRARDSYLKARDTALERDVVDKLRPFFSADVQIWENVYETPDCQFEHDAIILDDELCIVAEAKAKPPIEPFRDPDRAFNRLRHAFHGDAGIQKGFEQANRVVEKLHSGQNVTLYDKKGNKVGELQPDAAKATIAVCTTRDNYGLLATNLRLLLEKDDNDNYPWIVNTLDLENLRMAWDNFGWGSRELRKYLEQRIQLHGKAISDDELDFAGYYIRHGSFESVIHVKADMVQLTPEYSSVFDDLYRNIHQAGPPVVFEPQPPVMADLRRSLSEGEAVFVEPRPQTTSKEKVGRNDPCPCGSGKKYKKCCGLHPDLR